MSRPGVLVIGDVIVDRRIEGDMTRISPEAPSPIIRQRSVTSVGGGAANVAAGIAALGHKVWLLGAAAEDADAAGLARWLADHGVNNNFVSPQQAKTIVKTRITCGGRQVLRVDDEADRVGEPNSTAASVAQAVGYAIDTTPDIRLVVVADYAKGTLPDDLIAWLLAYCNNHGIPVFVDSKPARYHLYAGAALVKPNLAEAKAVLALDHSAHAMLLSAFNTDDGVADAAIRHLRDNRHFGSVVVTRGEHGAVAWSPETGEFSVPSVPQHVFDVTGAGDTFMAVLAASYLDGRPFREGVVRANAAASLAVSQYGTYIVSTDELETALAKAAGGGGKLMSMEGAAAWAARQRRLGRQVVLTNGCFDLFHHGHFETITFAKSQGDLLIVAYNSDASVRQLKGESRPLVPSGYRAALLSYMPDVDVVVEFDGDAEALMRRIHPDVLVKGAEYREARVPGADYVAAHGGRIEFAPMVAGVHTSLIVGRALTPPA